MSSFICPVRSVSNRLQILLRSRPLTFTEKSGHYGAGAPVVVVTTTAGEVTEDTTTEAVLPTTPILVTATSVYDNTKTATATITVA